MRVFALVLVIAMALGVAAAAVERKPLPEVDLATRDGGIVRADTVARDGTWVMFYVHSGCRSCEAVLSALDGLEATDGTARVTIVAETKDAAELTSLVARFPHLASVQWLADVTGEMGERVAPQAAATVLGLQGTMIEWSVAGIVTDAAQVKSVVTAWLNR